MASERWTDERARVAVLTLLVGVILLSWMLLMPQGAQPDEASHLVRSAAVVRLAEGDGAHVVPDRYRVAEPACYAFDPFQPASCATVPEHVDGDTYQITRAGDYPPGAHLVFGVVGLLPGPDPVWWARLAATTISALLVGWALAVASRRDAMLAAALLLGLTPMAWSIMTAVNPSAFATAGAAALWIGGLELLDGPEHARRTPTVERRGVADGGWLLTVGWVAMTLARRDGLVWACIAVAVLAVTCGRTPLQLARRLGWYRIAPIAAATAVTMLWGLSSSANSSRLVVLAPLVLVAAEAALRISPQLGTAERRGSAAALALGAVVAWPLLVSLRPGGWDTNLVLTVIAQTDENLVEAVGVLGWLDTPVPAWVVDGWLLAIGALLAVAVLSRTWRPPVALAGVVVLTSWTLELLQGNTSGSYWQGRYSLPLLVGVPLLLVRGAGRLTDRLVAPVTVASLLFVNAGAWAAARRFGVGHAGSHLPWRWDTPLQPVHPLLLLLVMAAASAALAGVIARQAPDRR